jgi:hypothetical protein
VWFRIGDAGVLVSEKTAMPQIRSDFCL